jgi:molybdopterin/thiamine biosynthesis adenylyltransferase
VDTLDDQQLLRYSRQIMLGDVDIEGQLNWLNSRALIIGAGGLGSPAALYLASAGVGTLEIIDDDHVDLSNLQRQIAHTTDRIGQRKVTSLATAILAINPDIQVDTCDQRLDEPALLAKIEQADVVLDCTDNFETRFLINRCCVKSKTPLVSGAAIRMEGHISVFDPADENSPCYQCLYPPGQDAELTCSQAGVLSPLVGVIGSMQAVEALKVLTNLGEPLVGRLQVYDAKYGQWRTLKLKRDPKCPICNTDH